MNQPIPKIRDFSERLVLIGMTGANASELKPSTLFNIFEKLRPYLSKIVGNTGFNALLTRSLAETKTDAIWLGVLHVKPDGSLDGLSHLEAIDPAELAEIRVIFLAEFIRLLVQLVGERMVLQLIHQAMPKVSRKSLYF